MDKILRLIEKIVIKWCPWCGLFRLNPATLWDHELKRVKELEDELDVIVVLFAKPYRYHEDEEVSGPSSFLE